jgi:hypothetical protein
VRAGLRAGSLIPGWLTRHRRLGSSRCSVDQPPGHSLRAAQTLASLTIVPCSAALPAASTLFAAGALRPRPSPGHAVAASGNGDLPAPTALASGPGFCTLPAPRAASGSATLDLAQSRSEWSWPCPVHAQSAWIARPEPPNRPRAGSEPAPFALLAGIGHFRGPASRPGIAARYRRRDGRRAPSARAPLEGPDPTRVTQRPTSAERSGRRAVREESCGGVSNGPRRP